MTIMGVSLPGGSTRVDGMLHAASACYAFRSKPWACVCSGLSWDVLRFHDPHRSLRAQCSRTHFPYFRCAYRCGVQYIVLCQHIALQSSTFPYWYHSDGEHGPRARTLNKLAGIGLTEVVFVREPVRCLM